MDQMKDQESQQGGKILGTCPICKKYSRLTRQHIKHIPGLDSYQIMICDSCHKIISGYEAEIERALKFLTK
jgi:C4-type Zn-finger protein